MRHRRLTNKFSRVTSHRKSMFRNMVTSLFQFEKIETTTAKAKELIKKAEKMITLAKNGGLHSRRQVESFIRSHKICQKLFKEAQDNYYVRNGGHLRITSTFIRKGDASPMSIVEIIKPSIKN